MASSSKLILEESQPFPSPTGAYVARVSSRRSSPSQSLSQAGVSGELGGSGLVCFYAPRVSMSFEWAGDHTLTIRYPNDLPPPRIDATNSSFGLGGRGKVIYEAVARSRIAPLSWSRTGEVAVSAAETLERGTLTTMRVGSRRVYLYSYYDAHETDASVETLRSWGLQGGGETWAGIVHGLVAQHAPELMEGLELDPEADGLSVRSKKRAALIAVAALIATAKRDIAILEAAVERARVDGQIE